MVEAIWTGEYPCLCVGEWKLYIDNVDCTHLIPVELRKVPMNTAGMYSSWHFENWTEVFESYEDGLEYEEWIHANEWVYSLPANPVDVYNSFQANDWRHGSCGGCI